MNLTKVFAYITFTLLVVGGWTPQSSAQQSNDEKFDLLVTPAQPGFILLGVEPAAVERPENVTDLAVTVLSLSENVNPLPRDYAVQMAPYWIFSGKKANWKNFNDDKPFRTMLRTLSVSVAASSASALNTDIDGTAIAGAIRFSVFQGKFDPASTERVTALAKKRVALRNERKEMIKNDVSTEDQAERLRLPEADVTVARNALKDTPARREGFKLDVAGGVAGDFPSRVSSYGKLTRWGAWTTAGYEGGHFGGLGVLRMIGSQSRERTLRSTSVDIGARLLYDDQKKFNVSIEGVVRYLKTDAETDKLYRLAFVGEYGLANSKKLSFTFGRDFEGAQSGNVLALLALVLGFGSNRPVE